MREKHYWLLVASALAISATPQTAISGEFSEGSVVHVRSDTSKGQGFAIARGTECLVVTAFHVVGEEINDNSDAVSDKRVRSLRNITVMGQGRAEGLADYLWSNPAADIAAIKVTTNGDQICVDKSNASKVNVEVLSRSLSGGIFSRTAQIYFEQEDYFGIQPIQMQFSEGDSGSPVFEKGQLFGILLSVDQKRGGGIGRKWSYIAGLAPHLFQPDREREPSEEEMREAVTAGIGSINSNLSRLSEGCKRGEYQDNQAMAVQCLSICFASGGSCEIDYQIGSVHKKACKQSSEQAGYVCDFTFSMTSNNPIMKDVLKLVPQIADGQGRFVRQNSRWLYMPLQK